MSDLVTGEAVVLGLRAAKLPSRALARLIDTVAQVIGWIVTAMVAIAVAGNADEAAIAAIMLSILVFFLVVLPVLVETLSKGRSLGKLALGLRVVRTDGGPVRFRHALVRGLVGVVEFSMAGAPAVISSLISPEGRRLGDIFAGTLVVRERVPAAALSHGALPPVPPQVLHALGADLVAMDLSAVPEPLWLAIRQYLGRIGQLDPAVAHGMAQRLSADLAGHTGRPVPYGVMPAMYLGAVLTERQRREWERATAAAPRWGAAPGQPYHRPAQPQQVAAVPQAPQPHPQPQPQPQHEPQPRPGEATAGGFAPPA
ncbi:RDD family protein [Kitasatospora sp. NPDC048540]|uniref:RDD family protein n=1 Tax=unclassified Kitasatospora TaxID=2633591 RepID=UPI0005398314|nr:RDD family protein [Kitasatospora sp. MBT63]